ncbi:nucleoside kinase [Prevotella nigrescens]|jgi:phosphoribulokinase/uridine kinase family protein|uniref:nucleoside kinase n=1 Tax=Prevotella nigrescens TaxID=28133 RepID=UPI0002184A72|nr:nucleoside kinase [Prevotella nigrescens]EGQ14316.1 phosphoribulokinase [Prevotella nigrescens ATCC 33563]UAK28479.1 nucleoside kinase [Prevotella nigrescens]WMS22416.1 nucleoside kinase [Prevotella nigrescens]SUB93157.1 Uridine kinase [Prevotella nigrescens]
MKQVIQIRCKNNKKTLEVPIGSTLYEIYNVFNLKMYFGPVSAKVNNKVEGLDYRVFHNKDVEFLDLYSASGMRAYTRSLFMVLCKAVHDLYPKSKVVIDIPVSNGYYCNINIHREVTDSDIENIHRRMQTIVGEALPIQRYETTTEEAISMFRNLGDEAKVKLLESMGSLYTTYYKLDDYVDYYYGAMLTNTSQIKLFGIEKFFDGLLLRVPSSEDPAKLDNLINQDKMFEVFRVHHRWQDILGVRTVGDFNEAVRRGFSNDLINVSEALQEKKISQMAETIANKKDVKVVLIAGPSSSGKTTFCKRLSVQLLTCGIKPVQISLDDYFVNRVDTPKDETGDYDYESLYALNIPLVNEQFLALFRGEEVQLPSYNFQTGKSEMKGKKLRLNSDNILIVEGIHALNPTLTKNIPDNKKFRIYASALTTILLDDHNYIPTTDNRLIRRIVRDHKYRGCSAQETIRRWPSVRAGEKKWIFPYQENADTMFNTAMLYEVAVLKAQAEAVLEQVPENCNEYAEAYRLRKFLGYFASLPFRSLPPTSLLREFLGGSSFKY